MLQKLEDFWTFKDWEVLQRREGRPKFGPLRRVRDASSDTEQTSVNKLSEDAVPGLKTSVNPKPTTSGRDSCMPEKSKHNVVDVNNNVDDDLSAIPGWYNIQDFREQFEIEMQMPFYTGCYISDADFIEHAKVKCPTSKSVRPVVKGTQSQYETIKSTQQTTPYRQTSSSQIQQTTFQPRVENVPNKFADGPRGSSVNNGAPTDVEIDKDIADIAAQLMRGESTLEIAKRLAEPKPLRSKPVRTRNIRMNDSEEITANVIEKLYPLLLHKSVTNTKTPCHTPSLPVQIQKIFSQIPFSTKALLQRSIMKLNFLSTKQKADPDKALFRSKSECEVNHVNFWNHASQQFTALPAYQYRSRSTIEMIPEQIKVTQVNRKKKQSGVGAQPAPKRQNNGKAKKQQPMTNPFNIFAIPIYIPTKRNSGN